METLFLVFMVILEIIAIVDVTQTSLSGKKKLLWIILILCVPFLGVVLYFLLGRPEKLQAA